MIRRKTEISETPVILEKIRHYCGYQERCIRDVQEKLKDWVVQKKRIPGIIDQLQKEGFLNEERFAKAYARGKFRLNKWGRQKIEFELKLRGIPELLINAGLRDIDEEEYRQVLRDLILRKEKEHRPEKDFTIREKILNFALGKGYEIDLVLDMMKKLKI
jgi:regulatory protein